MVANRAMMRFTRINPQSMRSREYLALDDAVWQAALWFTKSPHYGERGEIEARYSSPDFQDVEETLALVERLVADGSDNEGGVEKHNTDSELADLSLGACFVDLIDSRVEQELPALEITLGSGRSIGERQMLAALVLAQCEIAARSIDDGDADAVAWLMWDVHVLLRAMDVRVSELKRGGAARDKSKRLNQGRHSNSREAKALLVAEWEKAPSKFRSAEAAATFFVPWLAARGHDYMQRTVRDWILAHAKAIGRRLR